MALPEVSQFEEFLTGVGISAQKPVSDHYEVIHSAEASNQGDGVTLYLEFRPGELQLSSALRKIGESLDAAGSPASRPVALAVLGLIAATKREEAHVAHANHVLRELRRVNLLFNHVVLTPPVAAVDIRADYGPMKIEPFDPTRLEYWARRGQARWPVDLKDLRGRTALVGAVDDVTVLNIDRLPRASLQAKVHGVAPEAIVDCYYQAVADVLLKRAMSATTARLSLVEAANLAGLHVSSLTTWSLGIHLFTWATSPAGSAGCWAVFRRPGLQLNVPPARIWATARQWLSSEFGLDGFPDRQPIDHIAHTFARQMQNARYHLSERRINDAFLYFVIALDHLLGEDGRSVSAVTTRTCVLTHTMRSRSFDEEMAAVRRIYDVRSRLVHSASDVSEADLREADEIARCVLWALTRVVAAGAHVTRDSWVEAIDKIAHLHLGDANLVTPDRLETVGVTDGFTSGPPPPLRPYPDGPQR
jgi:hypothetical protein